MSASAASYRQTALRKAEKLRKQLRKDVKKIQELEDVRNKYSLPDELIIRLLPKMSLRKVSQPSRRYKNSNKGGKKPPLTIDPEKQLKREREAALRSGRRIATELAGLEQRRPVQLLLLKCSAVIVQDILSKLQITRELEKQRNTRLIMCMTPEARKRQRILEVALDRQAYALALKEGCGKGRFDDEKEEDENEPLPIVRDIDQYGRFSFDELANLFPILAHNSLQELGREIEMLEAQKLILRDHDSESGKTLHLNNLPLTAEIPAEYVHGGRPGMRLWMERTIPKVFLNKLFLKELDKIGITSLHALTKVSTEKLSDMVTIGLNMKLKGTKRRRDELLTAVSALKIGMHGDYDYQRRRVSFRYSKRTGAVLFKMLLRGLSSANSSVPGDTNKYCSGCVYGLVAHNWDCGQSQMDLLNKRLRVLQEQRAHRPLPRSDDQEMMDELTWYEALRKKLHLHRGWGFGANPKNTVLPQSTIYRRGENKKDAKLLAQQKMLNDINDWKKHKDDCLHTNMRKYNLNDDDESIQQRFVTSPRIAGAKLRPIPTRFSVWIKPETATQVMGRKKGGTGEDLGGLHTGAHNWNTWSRTIVPPKFEIEVKTQIEPLILLNEKTDPLLDYFKKRRRRRKEGSSLTLKPKLPSTMQSSGKHMISQTMLEFDGVDVIGQFEERRGKSMSFGVIQR